MRRGFTLKRQWFYIILFVFLAADDTDCADFNTRILFMIRFIRAFLIRAIRVIRS